MARRLRSEGYSVREIEQRLGVARSSVSLWGALQEYGGFERPEGLG